MLLAPPLFCVFGWQWTLLMSCYQRVEDLVPSRKTRLHLFPVLQISRSVHALLTGSSIFPPQEGTILLLDTSCCGSCAENYRMGGNKSAGWVWVVMLYNHHIHEPQMAL